MFYYLKGGRVDYGEEHSKACGHSQFGRLYEQGSGFPHSFFSLLLFDKNCLCCKPHSLSKFLMVCCNWDAGHYPEWDEDHPIHFVGHSAGAQVVRVLQQMLADKVSPNCITKLMKKL